MEVILLQKVQKLGGLGDKVTVKPGYGRNYLVPQGKAVPATEEALAEFESRRAEYEAKAQAAHDEAAARLAKLEDVTVTIRANASPEGKLYGSIGPRDIAEALTAQTGVEFEKSEVVMGEGPFRLTGEFEVLLHLHADVETTVPVVVEAESAA
ncbi:MAG: 50S ribosomal protein L9 [Gammaproteobacteria bacterium]|nr:50S ribosomal protein L9 [Gammaproteobacteria bacterium]